jgi:hypothetical protein
MQEAPTRPRRPARKPLREAESPPGIDPIAKEDSSPSLRGFEPARKKVLPLPLEHTLGLASPLHAARAMARRSCSIAGGKGMVPGPKVEYLLWALPHMTQEKIQARTMSGWPPGNHRLWLLSSSSLLLARAQGVRLDLALSSPKGDGSERPSARAGNRGKRAGLRLSLYLKM